MISEEPMPYGNDNFIYTLLPANTKTENHYANQI